MKLDEEDTAEGGDAFNIINPFRPETQSTRMMQQSQILAADGRLFNRTEYIPPPISTLRPPPSINTNTAQTSSNLNTRHLTRTTTHFRTTSPIVDSDLDDTADPDAQPLIANRLASILPLSHFARPAKIVTKRQPFDSAAPGPDPLAFMRLFEIAAKANNWNDAIKLQRFPTFLINKSLQWYISLNDDRSRLGKFSWTWQELKQEFLDTGGSVETRKQFLGFKLQQQRQCKAESCHKLEVFCTNKRRYPDRRPIHQGYPNQQRYNTRQFYPRYKSQVAPRPPNFNYTYGQFRTPSYNPRANYQPNSYRQHPYPNRSGRPPLPISARVNYADGDVNNNVLSSTL
ncbi:unnamed protein product [Orchesella dallaii]|uniref:Retrotransposon gag domain-containing protein n=1 Tax=Orchesella dallaii TaxID=48710 RepID=A0ABP1RB92_9HEXA